MLRESGFFVFSLFHPDWIEQQLPGADFEGHGTSFPDWWGGRYRLALFETDGVVRELRASGFAKDVEVCEPLVRAGDAGKAPYRFLPVEDHADEIRMAGRIPSVAIFRARTVPRQARQNPTSSQGGHDVDQTSLSDVDGTM